MSGIADAGTPSHPLTRAYSQRLGVLTAGQLQAALARFDLGDLLDARPALGGLFGQNVLLTSTRGRYVLRGAAHYDGQFQKERYFSRAVHERTQANAPWPFLIEPSTDLFGWSYAVMPQIPGEHLSDPEAQRARTPDDRVAVARAMGEYLARIHAGDWDVPAVYDYPTDELKPIDQSFAAWFVAGTREWLGRCLRASAATTATDVDWVEAIIARAEDALAVPFEPSLVHTDYAEGNVVAERVSGGWRVNGVFDLGEAYIGDGEYDLARLACWYSRTTPEGLRACIDAYAAERPLRDGFEQRFALYILTDRLILWEYGQRNHVWFKDGSPFRDWAEPFIRSVLS